jgi:hypothetical protein
VSLLGSNGAFRSVSQQGETVAPSGSLANSELIYALTSPLNWFWVCVAPQLKLVAIS